jgi:hypothetical protein
LVPARISPQVPFGELVRAALQAVQVAVQAVLQQNPSAQFPVMHWEERVQAAPCACRTVQTPATQASPLTQSEPTMQAFPVAHAAQVPPPQSTSVSLPFLTPSEQVGTRQTPPEQTLLEQSEEMRQTLPLAQAAQVPPPQSTSVSLPF